MSEPVSELETEMLTRRLTEVTVRGLLGAFDHKIEFPSEWEFVIIFGPNGVGKTRFLELIRSASSLNQMDLLQTPFSALTLKFSDGSILAFEKSMQEKPADLEEGEEFESRPKCDVLLTRPGADPCTFEIVSTWDARFEHYLKTTTSWREQGGGLWRDEADGEIVPISELYTRFGHVLNQMRHPNRPRRVDKAPVELVAFAESIPVHLIETQRLLIKGATRPREPWEDLPRDSYVRTVTQHSNDLRDQLSQTITEHSRLSQQLDRTFPRRIITMSSESESDKTIRTKYEAQNALRARLATFALIDAQDEVELPENYLSELEVKALSIYLEDTDRKLAVFTSLLERLELFVEIMNSRLIRKTVSIDVHKGLTVHRDVEGAEIPTESLSSGEQHELVLVYDLLFRTDRNSVVLIDEPEISLHVAWQKAFLKDIMKIAHLSSLRFIVATHSPQIIDEWWSRTNELAVD